MMTIVFVLKHSSGWHSGLPMRLVRALPGMPRPDDDLFVRVDDASIEREVTLRLLVTPSTVWAVGTTQSLPYVAVQVREVIQETSEAWTARWALDEGK